MKHTEVIRNLRADADLTQAKIASIIGVSQRTYADYEAGNVRIPVDALLKLAEYYDVDMNYICGLTNKKTKYPSK